MGETTVVVMVLEICSSLDCPPRYRENSPPAAPERGDTEDDQDRAEGGWDSGSMRAKNEYWGRSRRKRYEEALTEVSTSARKFATSWAFDTARPPASTDHPMDP
ncbi:hypothetical protein BU26DRAFT_507464 [Trematosphaeria pertusa]|uniref:Uncharacterized protein n=1 Tax=Trematosphaeria pertusa TaxID=390896 RepID=A0A6A6I9L5_9PLEO|nr:uncharacterized protein BU26DRAFT_507464 [Trematosphaeria pertusa]KAF2246957.1 hypothetical protein BU26DRAFT_507464 [Trematosphaeria pertusa]